MANIKAYQVLCVIAEKEQLPTRWENDLYVVDKSTLTEGSDNPVAFGWVLRECGTFLDNPLTYALERINHPATWLNVAYQVIQRWQLFSDRDTFQYYWYDEAGVQRVSQEDYIRYLENEVNCVSQDIQKGKAQ